MNLIEFLKKEQERLEPVLTAYLPPEDRYPQNYHKALRYSVLDGGKRLRPILAILVCRILGGEEANILPAACALEYIHCYSLVHDDLPALDNDALRRGKPTVHKAFGEAMAILVGDGLQTLAFWVIANATRDKDLVAPLVEELAWAAGNGGMVVGQVADIEGEKQEPTPEILDFIHKNKTGALLTACCRCGAIAARADQQKLDAITCYGRNFGLAFQIADDILDEVGDDTIMGKAVRKDQDGDKITYPRVWGIAKAKTQAAQLIQEAQDAIREIPGTELLEALACYIIERNK